MLAGLNLALNHKILCVLQFVLYRRAERNLDMF